MFSDKTNINILTALLLKHKITTAVVCPGSRNAPIVHNLHEAGVACHPVTDERSAGFYALGMSVAKGHEPVAVCVTSGTAILNLAPAVAEAYHQQCPLLIISADRPAERIGQLDAQTLPQQNALGCFVGMSVSLPEPTDAVSRAYCNRLVNEALLSLNSKPHIPIHINVPITEPLFNFSVETLPEERMIRCIRSQENSTKSICQEVINQLKKAARPMIVVGQMPCSEATDEFISAASQHITTLYEPLSCSFGGSVFDDSLAEIGSNTDFMPDFVLYIGGIIVSKRLKNFLQNAPKAETWLIGNDRKVHDTFLNLTAVIDAPAKLFLAEMAAQITATATFFAKNANANAINYKALWDKTLQETAQKTNSFLADFSAEGAVKLFESMLNSEESNIVHYANSTAVRLGCRHAKHYIYVNRGVNGIEGSLSTAAGHSLYHKGKTFCVIGDLSFFYDANALWNTEISGNLRILLINNGGGAIFRTLPGLEKSSVRERYIMAKHNTSAQGLCQTHSINYLCATDLDSLKQGIKSLVYTESDRPLLLEIEPSPQPSPQGEGVLKIDSSNNTN